MVVLLARLSPVVLGETVHVEDLSIRSVDVSVKDPIPEGAENAGSGIAFDDAVDVMATVGGRFLWAERPSVQLDHVLRMEGPR